MNNRILPPQPARFQPISACLNAFALVGALCRTGRRQVRGGHLSANSPSSHRWGRRAGVSDCPQGRISRL